MVGKNDKLGDMIKRNINEMGFAILQRKTMNGLESANFAHEGLDFFRITHISLFNDMMAHIIKVMDTNKQSATFWAIYDQYKVDIDSLWKQGGADIFLDCFTQPTPSFVGTPMDSSPRVTF